ncbi:Predicted amino acid racemase [Reichenbachiella faecimaris]|uniref:Predicted amino acid racemase n=1 Tax=Reichenbachiella faecimaris TaxID=692418 RepID=A0A1W2G621_REIFA|nr:alanine/ornithine racemase family PLP-dependent enzyme [Reichenbachiella faecimaris]SMD32053.1 Predicted amino acid racemase [Reichenbachiella faecimaris]
MSSPEIVVDLEKIASNVRALKALYGARGINIFAVTKAVCGDPNLANILVNNGLNFLADSRLENIKNILDAGVHAKFLLLRTLPSEVDAVVKYTEISLNSNLTVIQLLSKAAVKVNVVHKIILMIEMGDLREGVMPIDLNDMVRKILRLPNIKLIGIGTNLACFGGIKPNARKMRTLSSLAVDLEKRFNIILSIVSGGNSANYNWFTKSEVLGRINNLRLGESIFLGRETLERKPIPDLHTDAFALSVEVIDSGVKPSIPFGESGLDAFGNKPVFEDLGQINRAILAIGKLDVQTDGLIPPENMTILGASSDHLILNTHEKTLEVGDRVTFSLNYGALLSVMGSQTIIKNYVNTNEYRPILQNGRGERPKAQNAFSNHRD